MEQNAARGKSPSEPGVDQLRGQALELAKRTFATNDQIKALVVQSVHLIEECRQTLEAAERLLKRDKDEFLR